MLKVGENCTTVDGCVKGTTCEGTPTKKCTCPAKSGANTAKDKCGKCSDLVCVCVGGGGGGGGGDGGGRSAVVVWW